jgi:hypothetical protein
MAFPYTFVGNSQEEVYYFYMYLDKERKCMYAYILSVSLQVLDF